MSCDVSRLRYRGGSVLVPALPICPASRFPHLVISCCLLGLPMSSPLCRLIACVPSSSRAVVPSSHPSSRAILLACRHASRFTARPASRFSSRSSPPVLPWVMSSPSCPITPPCRSACGHRSPRPACRLGWGRDGTGRLSLHRLPALPPLLALDGVLPACVSSLRYALLALVPPFVSVL